MARSLLVFLAILAAAWLEFAIFPGHTYLHSETPLYVPMLERIHSPGYLSRDLAATHPNLSLTAYDEITLGLLRTGRLAYREALQAQQLLGRLAALTGIFLLARSTGLDRLFAVLIAFLVNLGGWLAGPAVSLNPLEAAPYGIAFGLTLCAMGLISQEMPLLAGAAGGLALIYDPLIAAPFWAFVLFGALFDRRLRGLSRSVLPAFLVFVLLLGNLAQLQPAAGIENFFGKTSAFLAAFQIAHTPYMRASIWAGHEIWPYLALFTLAVWAALRISTYLPTKVRWMLLGTALAGLVAVPVSALFLDRLNFLWAAESQPARLLLFTVSASLLLFGLAGMRAVVARRPAEAFAWFALCFVLPLNTNLFDSFRLNSTARLEQLALPLVFAGLLTYSLLYLASSRWRAVALLVPVAAVFAYMKWTAQPPDPPGQRIQDVALWAEHSTWGGSLFWFPDSNRAKYPGAFRAISRRALWADWNDAPALAYSEKAALEWTTRWQSAEHDGFSPAAIEKALARPIDYYVLKQEHALAKPAPVFSTSAFAVYDAQDLRNASKPLRSR